MSNHLETLESRRLMSATLPAPTVVGPGTPTASGPVVTASPTFTWKAVTAVEFDAYQINLEDLTANKFVSYQVAPVATSLKVPAPLAAGDKFVWNLRLDADGGSGPPSTYLYFQTAGPVTPTVAPTVVGPGTAAAPGPVLTTASPTFTW